PNHTLNARKAFLGECPSADPEAVNKILSKFGKVRG
ncbi:kikA from plasmid origin, partial [Klebsiella quasipneumoniae]|nr:kikA from plasmid origin [Klebsiella quasipneumoniae]